MGNEDCDHSEDASLESSSIIHWSIELKEKNGEGVLLNCERLCRALSSIAFKIPLS